MYIHLSTIFYFLVITLAGLLYLPKHLKIWDNIRDDDENVSLNIGGFRRKRNMKKTKDT